jgi:hypothetical protein
MGKNERKFGMLAVVKIQQFAYTPEPPPTIPLRG